MIFMAAVVINDYHCDGLHELLKKVISCLFFLLRRIKPPALTDSCVISNTQADTIWPVQRNLLRSKLLQAPEKNTISLKKY